MQKALIFLAAALLVAAGYAYSQLGPFNGPSRPPPRDKWETLLRERIKLPEGYRFEVFARDLGRLRLMQMTENGDLIVSGYRDGNILLVKADRDGDGRSDGQQDLLEGLNQPHGLLLEGRTLYVAEEQRVVRYDFDGAKLENERVILEGIPADGHSSRTLKRGPDGFLYLSIGSSCNACIEEHPWRAAILRFKEGAAPEIFASGLRNTVGFDWQPGTGALFGVDNGRDNLGDDVPDDEVNRIEAGKHYGWPYVHGADVPDPSALCCHATGAFPGFAVPWAWRACGAPVDPVFAESGRYGAQWHGFGGRTWVVEPAAKRRDTESSGWFLKVILPAKRCFSRVARLTERLSAARWTFWRRLTAACL